jgi:hypothetical protein
MGRIVYEFFKEQQPGFDLAGKPKMFHRPAGGGGINHPFRSAFQRFNVLRGSIREMSYGAPHTAAHPVIFCIWTFLNGNLLHSSLACAQKV